MCHSCEDFRFFNIVPLSCGKEEQLAKECVEYYERTGFPVVLYCLTLHPEGFPATKKADILIESYRKLKACLAGTGVQLGVLFQSVLGHWARVDKTEEQWTRTIDLEGNVKRFCPLDERFRDYIRYFTERLAKENPVFVMTDDDVRSFSPQGECFCPLHTAEFNRRAGTNFTPEEYREAIAASKTGDRLFEIYNQLCEDTILGVVSLIRETLDSVDPRIDAGACMPGWEMEYRRVNKYAKKLTGAGHEAVLRICNGNYEEKSALDFSWFVLWTQELRQANSDIPWLLDESDTCPHNLWSKSARSMHTKLCSSIMCGLNGSKIWRINTHRDQELVSRNYTDIMAENKGLYSSLTREAQQGAQTGVMIPALARKTAGRSIVKLAEEERFIEDKNWADTVFGRMGIPFRASFDLTEPGIRALAGQKSVERFTDEELRGMLSGKILVDGQAAMALSRRGFSELIGVTAEDKDFRFNGERYSAKNAHLGYSKTRLAPFLSVVNPAASEVMTELIYEPFSASDEAETVCPATVFTRNSLGGYVCVTAYMMTMPYLSTYSEARRHWLLDILDKLSEGVFENALCCEQDALVVTRRVPDGELVYAVNLNFDELTRLAFRRASAPTCVQIMDGNGIWKDVPFAYADNQVTFDYTLHCYHGVVVKVK